MAPACVGARPGLHRLTSHASSALEDQQPTTSFALTSDKLHSVSEICNMLVRASPQEFVKSRIINFCWTSF